MYISPSKIKKTMKKIILIAFAFSIVSSSCKKIYTCECVFSINGAVYATTSDLIHDTKKKAKAECDDLTDTTPSASGAITVCTLK